MLQKLNNQRQATGFSNHGDTMKQLIDITLNELKRSKITAELLSTLPEDIRQDLIISCAMSAVKRFEKFQNEYLTKDSVKEFVRMFCLS